MAHILLAIFLVLFGLNILIDINLPSWILGTLALVANTPTPTEHFGITAKRK
jgi:hypothetical protein